MVDSVFVPGQRWVSNTESELGLGIVVENENRRVTVAFPAAGERRVYAADNAPLSRVIYNIGETIRGEDGASLHVTECKEDDGCYIYTGITESGAPGSIDEIDLDSFVQFSRPLDRLFAGQIEKNKAFNLRIETLTHQHRHLQSSAAGLLGPRVQLLPHQFYIADQVGGRYRPRVLLADEVGLGKTIEAGLVLHQQLLGGLAERVLIVVPDSLVHQWLVEMLRRFNLHFTILDEMTCAAIDDSDGGNPFESSQLILVGLSLLTENLVRQEQAAATTWDLMIVDEAHHLSWSEDRVSDAYAAVQTLAREVPALILITATPEQLGIDGHFARLRLLDPDRYHDLQEFVEEEAGYAPVAALVDRLTSLESLAAFNADSSLRELVASHLGSSTITAIEDGASDVDFKAAIAKVTASLLDRHGTGRVLYRNRRETIAGFPERQLHTYPLDAPADFDAQSKDVAVADLLIPEVLIGGGWLQSDPRVSWLVEWLAQHPGQRTLLICARAETAISLEEFLRTRHGTKSAVFHEGLDLIARDRAAAYFADEQDHASILICSEIGSEGRNFQFAGHLVLFDLPLNPDLLEQRIGRLDRIGQRNDVQIHVPYFAQSATHRLIDWYHEGLNAVEQVFPAGSVLFAEFETRLMAVLSGDDPHGHLQLLEDTRQRASRARDEMAKGRNRLLELNSFNPESAAEVVQAVMETTRPLELADFMDGIFDYFGVDQQPHGALSVVVHPGDHMLCHNFPGLPEGGITGTFDRAEALTHEDMHFLTWEHPMVTGAVDMMVAGEFGNATLCTMKAPFLKPGMLILEAIFVVSCAAPRYLQIQRYLPHGLIRVVVERSGRELTDILTAERINAVVTPIKKHVAREVVKHARDEINILADKAIEIADAKLPPLLEEAAAAIAADQHTEIERLEALAEVNPNIRPEEIEYRRRAAEDLLVHLNNAQLRFDSVRVGLAT